MSERTKNVFKKTLNLPKTPFSMRANLAEQEPLTLKKWEKSKLYDRLQEQHQQRPAFIFHDGPPYANGDIHIGHLLNKTLKDFVVRSQHLLGNACAFTPGWDCHGLPIEHKVMTQLQSDDSPILKLALKEQRKAIRKACQTYAKSFIKTQSKQMQRLLTLADYKKPYLTMSKHFESQTLTVFAELVKKGLVYRQLKPVHWSLDNQTALAEAELEYQDKEDTAIYLAFDVDNADDLIKKHQLSSQKPLSLLVWTTTPWTLPANLAIAINDRNDYVVIEHQQRYLVLAKPLLASLQASLGFEEGKVLTTIPGKDLCSLSYQHPFCHRQGKVYSADFVTMEDGSGLVHIAPGHGLDDYHLGQTHGLDVYCPVDAKGFYDHSVPEWLVGKHIWKANLEIIERLKESQHLVNAKTFLHSYPHDWRSKTPVIFRSTEQWFIGVDRSFGNNQQTLRDAALTAIDQDIQFVPDWGQKRLRGMLEARPDWCISRQRSWGLPIPAFESPKGILLTKASVEAVAKVFKEEGSDAWFEHTPESLLRHYQLANDPDAPKDISLDELKPCFDIFDVWFESGSSWFSVMDHTSPNTPIDLYLEGSDQHRGWFHLSLLTSLGAKEKSPYKTLLTHGFIVDKDGRKMSKSSGNALHVNDLLKDYGAEVCRTWVASLKFENDIKVDRHFFDLAADQYRKIRNMLRFLLSNINDLDFKFNDQAEISNFMQSLESHDLNSWLLSECRALVMQCQEAFRNYQFKSAFQAISKFCQENLSAIYCSAMKDCLYCDAQQSQKRTNSQKTMLLVFEQLCHLLSVFYPHSANEAYLVHFPETEHLQLQDFEPLPDIKTGDWSEVFAMRDKALKEIEAAKVDQLDNPLDIGLVIPDPNEKLHFFESQLVDLLGVSRVKLEKSATTIQVQDLRQEARCERSWKRDETVSLYDGHWLSKRDFDALSLKGVLQ